MTRYGEALIRECFANAEVFDPDGDRKQEESSPTAPSKFLPQMPQMPQPTLCSYHVFDEREDAFEERAAIMEHEGGVPRALAEFLARGCSEPHNEAER